MNTKKIVTLLLLTIMGLKSFAYDFEVDGIIYKTTNNNTVSVLEKNNSYSGAIVIPESVSYQGVSYTVTTISEDAFWGETDITSIVIPKTIVFIDESAFSGCDNLDVVYASSIESWLNIGFENVSANPLQYAKHLYIDGKEVCDIVIPNGITEIDEWAFCGFKGITSLTLPNSLKYIWRGAFSDCRNLISVLSECDNPPFFDSDYGSPFSNISSKAKLVVPQGTINKYLSRPQWRNYFAEITEDINEKSNIISFSDTNVKKICIANWDSNGDGELSKVEASAVTDIGRAFRKSNIEIFPEFKYFTGLASVGEEAFEKCSSLSYIILPPNIKSIGHQAFKECGFTEFSIMDGVESIVYEAFQSCNSLKIISIPKSVKSISSLAFPHSITTITIDTDNGTYVCPTNSHCILEKETKKLIFGTNTSKIPAGTLSIGTYAFQGSSIKEIEMPNTVTSVGSNAFSGCNSLETLTLSNGLTEIGESAFNGCSSLSEVKLPNTVTTIGTTAFQNCSKISSITIPQNVTTLGGSAFIGCSGITTAIIKCKIDLPYQLFANCSSLSSVVLTDGINSIGNNVFVDCASLASIEIPGSVKSIGSTAFSGCRALASVIIPGSVTSIGNGAFANCTALSRVDSKIVSPFEISAFSGIPYDSELYVPYRKKSLYEKTKGWNVFGEIIEKEAPKYNLLITSTGNGSVKFDDKTIKNQSQSFVVSEGTSATIFFSSDNGYYVEHLTLNGQDAQSQIVDNSLTITITADTNVDVVFGEIPPTSYTLTISSTGNGQVTCQDITVRGESKTLSIVEGDNALITVLPDAGNRIKSVKVDGIDVTASLVNNQYTIAKIEKDMKLEVAFEAITNLSVDGVNYTVVSYENQTVNVIEGDYGLVLDIPSSITANDNTWKVIGVERDALNNNIDLAAIIWNPETKFDGNVSNPNLLLYIKDKSYAPAEIKNVIVNDVADAITLTDAESGNNFYCPQAFTAKSVTYEHNYSMKSGYNVCQGWETIVLPFDVGTISRESGEVLVPYVSWSVGSSKRPFWLYSLASDGWKAETAIKANTPYIICMPNNEYYDAVYNIKGNIVFAASNVEIKASDNLPNSKSGDRTFVPNYQNQEAAQNIYALNVNNLWSKNTDSSLAEGSAFIRDSRPVRPFEAYMTTESGSASRCIYIFGDDETTGMLKLPPLNTNLDGEVRVYSLSGTFIKQGNDEKVLKGLPKGMYIINGKKVLVK